MAAEDTTALIPAVSKASFCCQSTWLTYWLCISLIHALIGPLMMGYNVPIFNIANDTVRHRAAQSYINDIQWGIINAMYPFGALFGALSSGKLCDRFGRKKMILLMDMVHILAAVMVATSFYFLQLLVGRFITGIGSGMATVICSTYIKEISPPKYRGRLGALIQIGITFTLCVSMALGKLFQTDPIWRYGVLLPGMVSLIQILFAFSVLESPEWLRQKNQEISASDIERKLWGTHVPATPQLDEQEPKQSETNLLHIDDMVATPEKALSFRAILFDSLFVHGLQQLSGINAVFYYSEEILSETDEAGGNQGIRGIDPWLGSVYISVANWLSSTIVIFFVDKYGRKPLLIISCLGMCVAAMAITVMFMREWELGVVVCLIFFVVFFEIGLGPIPYFYVAELSPMKHRGDIMGYSLTMNWSINTLIALITPILINTADAFAFVPFGVVVLIGSAVIYFVFPETKSSR